ncbi:MAG: hypothetical protein EXR47_03330 [Dehalococcoidia bacterium]|nr:hypothetical protein [Dehalococcoidia bacterium]
MVTSVKSKAELGPNGRGIVDFWGWASQKGLLNQNTAATLRAACSEVLGVLDDWEQADLRSLDVEDVIRRFQNLRKTKYKPESLHAYTRRFRTALPSYLAYLDNPAAWKPAAREQTPREKASVGERNEAPGRVQSGRIGKRLNNENVGLIHYSFPLCESQLAYLNLPPDLKTAEVQRLQKFLESLAIDPKQ